jgi:hypothetical protein
MRSPFANEYRFWDSWYLYDESNQKFQALMLCAEKKYYEEGKHHEHSQLAYAYSDDLKNWQGHKKINLPLNSNSSIWTGSVIKWHNQYILAYTLRQTINDYFADQTICFATSTDFKNWTKCQEEFKIIDIDPKEEYFLRSPELRERTVHAWRDPYLFVYKDRLFMLVAAKRKDLSSNCRACVALFRAEPSQPLNFKWELICPSLVAGYEELEVPQIYIDRSRQVVWIIASTWDDRDYEISRLRGNRPMDTSSPPAYRRHGYLLGFQVSIDKFDRLLDEKPSNGLENTGIVLVKPEAMLYAGRIVPEQSETILGFDPRTGEPKVVHPKLSGKFDYLFPPSHKY